MVRGVMSCDALVGVVKALYEAYELNVNCTYGSKNIIKKLCRVPCVVFDCACCYMFVFASLLEA